MTDYPRSFCSVKFKAIDAVVIVEKDGVDSKLLTVKSR